MTTRAPVVRFVNALTGEVAARPSRFMQALSEADNLCERVATIPELERQIAEWNRCYGIAIAETDRLRHQNAELLIRVQELTAERDEALALVRQWYETALSAIPHMEGDL